MDEAEREFRNARAIGCWFRLKHAIMGGSALLLGLLISASLMSPSADGRDHGPWPWVAAVACWLIGPLLLWQAFRRSASQPLPGDTAPAARADGPKE